jgi:hypothetical protein
MPENIVPPDAVVESNKSNLLEENNAVTAPLGAVESDDETFKTVSFSALKARAPEVYDATLKGIAGTIISQMRRSNERIKKNIKGIT